MLFQEALTIQNDLTPSLYDEETRARWLLLVETQIFDEIIMTHTGWMCRTKPTGDMDSELLVPDQFAEDVYVNYLQARIAKENQESAKYNQAVALYNDALKRFSAWYNERHRPLPRGLCWRV